MKINTRKISYYKTKVQHLKKDESRMWWKIVNKNTKQWQENLRRITPPSLSRMEEPWNNQN
jgi:hypothetical protein